MKKKILICMGTRPEALKLASLIHCLKNHPKFKPVVLLSGQHLHMIYQVMDLFKIKADIDLKLMTANQSLSSLSERILARMESVLKKVKPSCVVIQGDTTTAFLTALSAFYQKIPVAHVEAGLRTDNKFQPFPEEINRRLITQLTDFHFSPTKIATNRLIKEGVPSKNILETGNTVIDALLWMKEQLRYQKKSPLKLPENKKIVLVTAHRRESIGEPLRNICSGIKRIAQNIPETEIYYPVHLNPNVRKEVYKMLSGIKNVHLMTPVAYDELVYMIHKSSLILTDSGGIQEEAPSFYKKVLVMRNVTERPEGVQAGFSTIVGQKPAKIFYEAKRYLLNGRLSEKLIGKKNPYGDGKAAQRIVRFLEKNV